MSLKSYVFGLLTGVLIAVLGLFLWQRSTSVPLLKETIVAQKNVDEIQKPTNTIIAKGQKVIVRYDVPTERYGLIQGTIEAPRAALTYNHSIGAGVVVLNTSALARVAYSYKSLELSGYFGYNYNNSLAYGFGIGGKWRF